MEPHQKNPPADLTALLTTEDEFRAGAIEQLVQICTEYIDEDKISPVRLGHVAETLSSIEIHARQLAKEIERLNDDLERTVGSQLGERSSHNDALDPWLSEYMPPLSREHANYLKTTSAKAGDARARLVLRFGSGDPDNPDRGGPALEERLHGKPKARLVRRLVFLWQSFNHPLSTTVGGDLDQFVERVWEWIRPGVDPKGLNHEVRKSIEAARLVRALEERRQDLDLCAANLSRIGAHNEADRCRQRSLRILSGIGRRYLI